MNIVIDNIKKRLYILVIMYAIFGFGVGIIVENYLKYIMLDDTSSIIIESLPYMLVFILLLYLIIVSLISIIRVKKNSLNKSNILKYSLIISLVLILVVYLAIIMSIPADMTKDIKAGLGTILSPIILIPLNIVLVTNMSIMSLLNFVGNDTLPYKSKSRVHVILTLAQIFIFIPSGMGFAPFIGIIIIYILLIAQIIISVFEYNKRRKLK